MIRRTIVILSLLFLGFQGTFGQTKREWIEHGDDAFREGDYFSAAHYYRKVFDDDVLDTKKRVFPYDVHPYRNLSDEEDTDSTPGDTTNREEREMTRATYVTRRVAHSYRLSGQYDKAEKWYGKLIENKKGRTAEDRLWYGDALLKNGKPKHAKKQLVLFRSNYDGDDGLLLIKAKTLLESCEFVISDPQNDELKVSLASDSLNKGTSNMGAKYYDPLGSVVFTSARVGNTVGEDDDPKMGKYLTDILIAEKNGEKWEKPRNIGPPINSEDLEGNGSLSEDSKKFYFTRCERKDGQCGIYLSRKLGGRWLKPLLLGETVNKEGYEAKHPMVARNGKVLYFASNRPGGYGKMDIWFCRLDNRGLPGKAHNLGRPVNTPDNEVSPFYAEDLEMLFFSSDGHVGMGGMDVFKAHGSDTAWSRPINLRPPVNSPKDELYYVLNHKRTEGYFSSDRMKCDSCETESSYCYNIFSVDGKPNLFRIQGVVYDQKTNEPIPNSLITIKDVEENAKTVYITTDSEGRYSNKLVEGIQYFVKAQKIDYFGDAASVSTKGLEKSKTFVKDFYLEPIPKGEIKIPGIRYDYDKATLRPRSKKILDTLTNFLEVNNNLVVQIRAHTDVRGSEDYNLDLSQRRARSVVDYLISKGIDPARLKPKGFGESKPVVKNAQTEEEHQENRRTTFKVLEQDFKDITR